MQNNDNLDHAIRARADLLTALVLVALGLIIFYLSWTMPRLENRHVHPATIPGLVPIFLSIALTVCGLLLLWRSAAGAVWRDSSPPARPFASGSFSAWR
jgi:hypothetical protein